MRVIHTSDWHLGRTLHGVVLLDAQAHFLSWLADLARDRRADVTVVSGDIYDRGLPSVSAVQVLEEGLDALAGRVPVVMIPGNHDSARRLGFGARWYDQRLHIPSTVAQGVTPLEIRDSRGDIALLIYAIPYLDPDLTREDVAHLTGEDPKNIARSHEAVMSRVVGAARADLEARRARGRRIPAMVMAHAFVSGGQSSESERDIRVGGVDCVPASVFDGFDYAALGHLHGPQAVGSSGNVRYSGSPLAYSFSEAQQRKSVAQVDFDDDGHVSAVELVQTPVPRRLSDVTGTLDEVLSDKYTSQREDWTRITVRGETRPEGLLSTLKKTFPFVLEHHFEPLGEAHPRGSLGVSRGIFDPVDVASAFVEQTTRLLPTSEELRVLKETYEQATRMREVSP